MKVIDGYVIAPCPFCGGKYQHVEHGISVSYYIYCVRHCRLLR